MIECMHQTRCVHGKVRTLSSFNQAYAKPKLENLYLIKGAIRQASFEAQIYLAIQITIFNKKLLVTLKVNMHYQ